MKLSVRTQMGRIARVGAPPAIALAAVVIGCVLAWQRVDEWFRREQAQRLAGQALRAPDGAAKAPVARLAKLGTLGVEQLAWLATESRADLARAAQDALNERLADWLGQWRDTGVADPLVDQLGPVLQVLRARAATLAPMDSKWCESFVLVSLDATAAMPPREATRLIVDCDAILATLPGRAGRAHVADPALASESNEFAPPAIDPRAMVAPTRLTSSPVVRPAASSAAPLSSPLAQPRDTGNATPPPVPTSRVAPPPVGEHKTPRLADDGPATPLEPRAAASAFGPGEVRPAPAMTALPSPQESRELYRRVTTMPTAQLFDWLATGNRYEVAAIRQELAQRGLDPDRVAPFNASGEQRTTDSADAAPTKDAPAASLAERLSELPAQEALLQLRRYAEAGSATERLEALSLLATMNDAQLAVIARRLATTDEDPRVAEQAAAILQQMRR